ncbi:hypothetical protein [Kitasatospora sp. MMS16-BH015]|uniref:hypothetical protein n=1 Tax=Kitasatospora sp. MMS16-BH015 TaxID=2018025 RepID=UPI000CF235E7|nr:hypothetical protein [Kitasatospora sp. MMS16-BH015]
MNIVDVERSVRKRRGSHGSGCGAVSAETARAAREQVTHAVARLFEEVSGQRFQEAALHILTDQVPAEAQGRPSVDA